MSGCTATPSTETVSIPASICEPFGAHIPHPARHDFGLASRPQSGGDPVTCEFYDRCNPPRPDDHVGYLPRIQASAVEELEDMGIESIRDIPDDFPLNEQQRRACTSVQTGEPWFSPGTQGRIE